MLSSKQAIKDGKIHTSRVATHVLTETTRTRREEIQYQSAFFALSVLGGMLSRSVSMESAKNLATPECLQGPATLVQLRQIEKAYPPSDEVPGDSPN